MVFVSHRSRSPVIPVFGSSGRNPPVYLLLWCFTAIHTFYLSRLRVSHLIWRWQCVWIHTHKKFCVVGPWWSPPKHRDWVIGCQAFKPSLHIKVKGRVLTLALDRGDSSMVSMGKKPATHRGLTEIQPTKVKSHRFGGDEVELRRNA